jgi:hypothetical protein
VPIDNQKHAQKMPAKLPKNRPTLGMDGQEIAEQAYL